jgi:Ser/Thr protein kinase RdoA (MazF antagonist)
MLGEVRGPTENKPFTADVAHDVLTQVCRRTGNQAGDARLLRLGQNASYALPDADLVVRIARSVEDRPQVERELAVARWLARQDFPAVRVADEIEQPLTIDGRVVTFWRLVPESDQSPTLRDLAMLLRRWHELPLPPFELPRFDPLAIVPSRLNRAEQENNVPAESISYLRQLCTDLAAEYDEMTFAITPELVHGDAHRGNLLIDNGQPILLDFEMVGLGPSMWDLLPTDIGSARFGLPEQEYQAFVAAYGKDVRELVGYPIMRDVRELTMVTWLMQNVGESQQIADEFAARVQSLKEGDRDRRWHVF